MSAEKFGGQLHLFTFQIGQFGVFSKVCQEIIVKRVEKQGRIQGNQYKYEKNIQSWKEYQCGQTDKEHGGAEFPCIQRSGKHLSLTGKEQHGCQLKQFLHNKQRQHRMEKRISLRQGQYQKKLRQFIRKRIQYLAESLSR